LEKEKGYRGATEIKKRKLNWIGHTVRKGNEAIERETFVWNWQGKRRRGTARYRGRRSVHSERLGNGKSWSEEDGQKYNQMAMFVDALCPEG